MLTQFNEHSQVICRLLSTRQRFSGMNFTQLIASDPIALLNFISTQKESTFLTDLLENHDFLKSLSASLLEKLDKKGIASRQLAFELLKNYSLCEDFWQATRDLLSAPDKNKLYDILLDDASLPSKTKNTTGQLLSNSDAAYYVQLISLHDAALTNKVMKKICGQEMISSILCEPCFMRLIATDSSIRSFLMNHVQKHLKMIDVGQQETEVLKQIRFLVILLSYAKHDHAVRLETINLILQLLHQHHPKMHNNTDESEDSAYAATINTIKLLQHQAIQMNKLYQVLKKIQWAYRHQEVNIAKKALICAAALANEILNSIEQLPVQAKSPTLQQNLEEIKAIAKKVTTIQTNSAQVSKSIPKTLANMLRTLPKLRETTLTSIRKLEKECTPLQVITSEMSLGTIIAAHCDCFSAHELKCVMNTFESHQTTTIERVNQTTIPRNISEEEITNNYSDSDSDSEPEIVASTTQADTSKPSVEIEAEHQKKTALRSL